MKRAIVFILFIVTVYFINGQSIPIHEPDLTHKSDVKTILKNLEYIPYSGAPGDLLVFGKDASVVMTNHERIPVIGYADYGKGKAVAVTHGAIFGKEAISTKAGGQLVSNLINLSGSGDKNILCIGINDLYAHLQHQYENVYSMNKVPRKLDQFNIIFINIPLWYDESFRERQVAKLDAFVKKGGILIAAAIGWVFINYGEGREGKSLDEFMGNRLFAPMGISWGGNVAMGIDGKYYLNKSIDNASHDLYVINKTLEKINKAEISKNKTETRQELKLLYEKLNKIHDIDLILHEDQIKALVLLFNELKEDIVPAKSNPIAITDLEASYLILYINAISKSHKYGDLLGAITADFPGRVTGGKSVKKEITIHTEVPEWHSTGLYAPAGQEIIITIPDDIRTKNLQVQIGCHSDQIVHLDEWLRWPDLTTRKSLNENLTKIKSNIGGLIYIVVPHGLDLPNKDVKIEIQGAITAPYFKLGETNVKEWRTMLSETSAPWGEIESNRLVISVPTSSLKKLDDPEKILTWWDTVINALYDLGQTSGKDRPERFVCDRQISAGYMHSGYPIMTWMDVTDFVIGVDQKLYKEGSWGHFHELGHNNQSGHWTFDGTGEVTCNLFTLYGMEKVVGIKAATHPWFGDAFERAKMNIKNGASFAIWHEDPALALVMYVQLLEKFGWQSFKNIFALYQTLSDDKLPKNDDEKRDQWMVRFSRETGYNLGPFFQKWGVPVSQQALDSIKNLKPWLPAEM